MLLGMKVFSFIPIAYAGVITDAPRVSEVLTNVLKWLLEVFGIIAVMVFVGSGILYLVASGNEGVIDRAKKWMMYSVLGIVIALGSLIALSTIRAIL